MNKSWEEDHVHVWASELNYNKSIACHRRQTPWALHRLHGSRLVMMGSFDAANDCAEPTEFRTRTISHIWALLVSFSFSSSRCCCLLLLSSSLSSQDSECAKSRNPYNPRSIDEKMIPSQSGSFWYLKFNGFAPSVLFLHAVLVF